MIKKLIVRTAPLCVITLVASCGDSATPAPPVRTAAPPHATPGSGKMESVQLTLSGTVNATVTSAESVTCSLNGSGTQLGLRFSVDGHVWSLVTESNSSAATRKPTAVSLFEAPGTAAQTLPISGDTIGTPDPRTAVAFSYVAGKDTLVVGTDNHSGTIDVDLTSSAARSGPVASAAGSHSAPPGPPVPPVDEHVTGSWRCS